MAVKQWGNVAGLVAGFYTSDYELIRRSIQDHIIEPQRSVLIPGFDNLKIAALDSGAIGCSISGSGPAVFALAKGIETAAFIKIKMEEQYSKTGIPFTIYLSKINSRGAHII
jgi:homoserine kinase